MVYDSLLTNCHSSTIHETFDELYFRKKTIVLCAIKISCVLYVVVYGRTIF